jgi:hypothetical protein
MSQSVDTLTADALQDTLCVRTVAA